MFLILLSSSYFFVFLSIAKDLVGQAEAALTIILSLAGNEG
jgi:hypothetical protein